MPEYIEREAAINAINESLKRVFVTHVGKDIIEKVQSADVRPVVRGHWITEEEAIKIGDYSKRDTCSVCGHCDWDCTESAYFNFCPNCGADMR